MYCIIETKLLIITIYVSKNIVTSIYDLIRNFKGQKSSIFVLIYLKGKYFVKHWRFLSIPLVATLRYVPIKVPSGWVANYRNINLPASKCKIPHCSPDPCTMRIHTMYPRCTRGLSRSFVSLPFYLRHCLWLFVFEVILSNKKWIININLLIKVL